MANAIQAIDSHITRTTMRKPDSHSLQSAMQLALAQHRAGRPREAEAIYRSILQTHPAHVDALLSLAIVLLQQGRHRDAEQTLRRAIAIEPGRPQLHFNLGHALAAQNALEPAIESYRKAVALSPDNVLAHNRLAQIFWSQGRMHEAEASLRSAMQCQPHNAEFRSNLGIILMDAGRHAEAEDILRQAIALDPRLLAARVNLGNCLQAQRRFEEAERCLEEALKNHPASIDVLKNLGIVLLRQGRYAEAEAILRQALASHAEDAEIHYNLGAALQAQQNFSAAETAFRTAHAKGMREAQHKLAALFLQQERYAEGWPYFEARPHPEVAAKALASPYRLPFPAWQGEALAGKSVLVFAEQGFGDQIQFIRYISTLKQLGASRITLICHPAIKPLLASLADIDELLCRYDDLPVHDYWTFLLSIPGHVHGTLRRIPDALPYLHAEPARLAHWSARLPQDGLRVGLVWKGNPAHKNDAHRSLPSLATLAPLWAIRGVHFISLQKGQGEDEAAPLHATQPLLALGPEVEDFADMAAIVAQLDLVICVDTAIAHLAGALGQSCWLLLPAIDTDWRWLTQRSDSPWYPGCMRLFRQSQPGDWHAVIAQLAEALLQLSCATTNPSS